MRNSIIYSAIVALLLTGCTKIEKQFDGPEKTALPSISEKVVAKTKWQTSVGNGVGKKDFKLLLAEHADELVTVDYKGLVTVVDRSSGSKIYDFDLNVPVSSGPYVYSNHAIFGSSDGRVTLFDLEKRQIVWTTQASSEVLAAPKIDGDIVYVHSLDGSLSALNLHNGKQIWRFSSNLPPLMLRRASTPAVASDKVIAGFSNGKMLAIRKQDGNVDWATDVAEPKGATDVQRMVDISADPKVIGDTVYAASYQGSLAALSLQSGQIRWETKVPSFSGFVVDGEMLFVAETYGNVTAVDRKTGETYWLQPGLQGRRLSKPTVVGNNIVVGDEDGYIHFINKNSGDLVGRTLVDKAGIESDILYSNNTIFAMGRGGKLHALKTQGVVDAESS